MFKDRYLQRQIVCRIPIADVRLQDLRRRIASMFLFEDEAFAQSMEDKLTLAALSERLAQPDLKVTRQTDYHRLLDVMRIWEAALVGISPPSPPCPPPIIPGSPDINEGDEVTNINPQNPTTTVGDAAATAAAKVAAKEIESDFNATADRIMSQLEFLHASIQGGGASELIRVQTKEFLLILIAHVGFTVRTVRKRTKDHYGLGHTRRRNAKEEEDEEQQRTRQKGFMSRFLEKG